MITYKSVKGGVENVSFEDVILQGYAPDGGLYVPGKLPQIGLEQLTHWKGLHYTDLAFEILSLFIDHETISTNDLKKLISNAYATFEHTDIIPLHKINSRDHTWIMELFHGPTLSFKDIGMAFLVNLVNFFLKKRNERLSVIVATTGDTGPAAAHFIAGKSQLDGWILYPKGMITEEQERQMTTLPHQNIYPVGVENCPEGGDDLDAVISKFYADETFKSKLKLSSVNSLNWGRILMQTVHYFYGYLQIVDEIGELINFAVPSGGFGNLCAGGIARKMGLPVKKFIVANNQNACLHRIFRKGEFSKKDLYSTASSAIDILIPINFWRYLYFCVGGNTKALKKWIDEFQNKGIVSFDKKTHASLSEGFLSISISDELTLKTIRDFYEQEEYILDPHGAVALAAINRLSDRLGDHKLISMITAHPVKFPSVIKLAFSGVSEIPEVTHTFIENAKNSCQKIYSCDCDQLETALKKLMEQNWDFKKKET